MSTQVDKQKKIEILSLLVGSSHSASKEILDAIKAIRINSPMADHRFERAVSLALGDAQSSLSKTARATVMARYREFIQDQK